MGVCQTPLTLSSFVLLSGIAPQCSEVVAIIAPKLPHYADGRSHDAWSEAIRLTARPGAQDSTAGTQPSLLPSRGTALNLKRCDDIPPEALACYMLICGAVANACHGWQGATYIDSKRLAHELICLFCNRFSSWLVWYAWSAYVLLAF